MQSSHIFIKKGDKENSNNYRGISLPDTAYKIFSKIFATLYKRHLFGILYLRSTEETNKLKNYIGIILY